MAAEAKQFVVGEGKSARVYHLLFSTNALFTLQRASGLTVQEMGLRLLTGQAGAMELQQMLWAGIEGYRLKHSPRKPELSMMEVGDLIDDAGGFIEFWDEKSPFMAVVLEAWQSAFPKPRKDAEPIEGGAEKNDEAAASTGTNSSTLPSSTD